MSTVMESDSREALPENTWRLRRSNLIRDVASRTRRARGRDYDAAIRCFVDVLQFNVVEDTPSLTSDGRSKRWVVIRLDRGQTRIFLARADGDQQTRIVGQQFVGRVGFFLRVDDFDAAYQRMLAAGVQFVAPPRDEPSGRLAVLLDLEGNRWHLLWPDPRRQHFLC